MGADDGTHGLRGAADRGSCRLVSGETTVVVLQDALPRYRRQFFEDLRTELGASGILLRLLHGGGNEDFALRDDLDAPEWAMQVPTLRWSVAGRQLAWQRCQRAVRGASLVIVEQASRHLVNYALLARQHLGGAPVAFWGHGKNFAIDHHSALGEAIKRRVSRLPHWWFVYTDEGVQIVTELGFPRERITVVRNSTDTAALAAQARKLSPEAVSAQRERLGLSGSNVGAYVGSLTVSKRLDFLIDAADAIRRRVPDFELLVLGGGECHPQVSEAAAARPVAAPIGSRARQRTRRLRPNREAAHGPSLGGAHRRGQLRLRHGCATRT